MTDANARFQGTIPDLYDRHLGPVIFRPYAEDLAQRLIVSDADRVLETACGTGILTKELRARLPRAARLVATDLNEPMIAYAGTKLADMDEIEWQTADAAALPFPPDSFDAVVCQFGVMFVPDKAAAFREARRVLACGTWRLARTRGRACGGGTRPRGRRPAVSFDDAGGRRDRKGRRRLVQVAAAALISARAASASSDATRPTGPMSSATSRSAAAPCRHTA